MTRYISGEDYVFLKQFLIPSFTLNSKKIRDQLINSSHNNWILKRSSGGRGIGMYEKNNCSESLWKKVVTEQWADYMVQEYISQKELSISYKGDKQTINVVGMLLAYNEQSFGLGIYRGSTESIINVHSGAYVFPSVIAV
jgi:predicted ATP-grasp superfamily ATP-dependent carboligase